MRIVYLSPAHHQVNRGLFITAVGKQTIAPHTPYPVQTDHPEGYFFHYQKGRVLPEYQIVLIMQGQGHLQTALHTQTLKAGSIMVLKPGQWHRYKPSANHGWAEFFVGFAGWYFKQYSALNHQLPAVLSNLTRATQQTIGQLLNEVLQLCGQKPRHYQHIATAKVQIIINELLNALPQQLPVNQQNLQKMEQAASFIRSGYGSPIDFKNLASSFALSYSNFRHLFKQHYNQTPLQFQHHIIVTIAKNLILNTRYQISEIASMVGFEDLQYFSRFFKKATGQSPRQFRQCHQNSNSDG